MTVCDGTGDGDARHRPAPPRALTATFTAITTTVSTYEDMYLRVDPRQTTEVHSQEGGVQKERRHVSDAERARGHLLAPASQPASQRNRSSYIHMHMPSKRASKQTRTKSSKQARTHGHTASACRHTQSSTDTSKHARTRASKHRHTAIKHTRTHSKQARTHARTHAWTAPLYPLECHNESATATVNLRLRA